MKTELGFQIETALELPYWPGFYYHYNFFKKKLLEISKLVYTQCLVKNLRVYVYPFIFIFIFFC